MSRHASDITNALQELGLDEIDDPMPVITGDINCVQHNIRPCRRMQRRESFKDKFVRKVSGGNNRKDGDLNHPAADTSKDLEDMKVHEFDSNAPSPSTDRAVVESKCIKPDPPTNDDTTNQKINQRRNRVNNTLTTSSVFKNLMKGAILSEDSSKDPPELCMARHNTVADMTSDNAIIRANPNQALMKLVVE